MDFRLNAARWNAARRENTLGDGEPWRVTEYHGFWYIVNLESHKGKRIGRVGCRRVNYYDRAKAEARKRNLALHPELAPAPDYYVVVFAGTETSSWFRMDIKHTETVPDICAIGEYLETQERFKVTHYYQQVTMRIFDRELKDGIVMVTTHRDERIVINPIRHL